MKRGNYIGIRRMIIIVILAGMFTVLIIMAAISDRRDAQNRLDSLYRRCAQNNGTWSEFKDGTYSCSFKPAEQGR